MTDRTYLGRGWAFPIHFASAESKPTLVDEDACVQQAIRLALNTQMHERPLYADYGSQLSDFAFSGLEPMALAQLKEEIVSCLRLNERRIEVLNIHFDSSDISQGCLQISLEYQVFGRHQIGSLVLPFYLNDLA